MSIPPSPTERLLEALDPQGDVDLGLAVVIAQDLTDDAVAVLAELVHKRIVRAVADSYDRGYADHAEGR